MTLRSFIACCVACASWPAAAMLTRADRDDAEYLELASRYTSSITLGASGGEGVLIQQGWILTTASNARALGARNAAIRIGGVTSGVDKVFPHPKARPGQPEDLALVRLKAPVRTLTPTRLCRDTGEAGQGLVVVAHGKRDGKPRAGINTVDRVLPSAFEARIKTGDDASDLQGVLVAGEEGAAAYIETRNEICVAGLYHGDGAGANVFSRMSSFVDWVEATMVGAERDALQEQLER